VGRISKVIWEDYKLTFMLIVMLLIFVYLNIVNYASWCISCAVQLATTVSQPIVATAVVAVPKCIPGSINSDTTNNDITVNVRLNVTLKRVLLTMAAVENQ